MGNELPRKPVELYLHRHQGAVGCVTAQALYVFGRTRRPSAVAVERAIGLRSPDEPLTDPDAHFYLLRHGFQQVGISSFDLTRFLQEGKKYLKEVYRSEWSEEHEAFFTPAKVKEIQALDAAHAVRLKPYLESKALRIITRAAVKDDVAQLLKTGYAVDATFGNGRPNSDRIQPAVLLVPNKSGPGAGVWAYFPDFRTRGTTVERLTLDEALRWVCYNRPIMGLKHY